MHDAADPRPSRWRAWFRPQKSVGATVVWISSRLILVLLLFAIVLVPILALWMAILVVPAVVIWWLFGRRQREDGPRDPSRPR